MRNLNVYDDRDRHLLCSDDPVVSLRSSLEDLEAAKLNGSGAATPKISKINGPSEDYNPDAYLEKGQR